MRGVVPHLLGQPGRPARGEPRSVLQGALPYLDQLDVDVITFEGAFNRGMDFEHIGKMISKDKKVALGVISHRTLQVERPEEIAELIRLALKHIEPERLILSSDCGFGRQSMSRMHAFYKMVALVRGANIVRKASVAGDLCSGGGRPAVDGAGGRALVGAAPPKRAMCAGDFAILLHGRGGRCGP